MPEQIAVAFEVVRAVVEIDDAKISIAELVHVIRHFALTRCVHHAAGNYKFSVSTFLARENLIGSEDHVFEALHWLDGCNLTSALLQNATEILPLAARFYTVHCEFSRHVGIFLINDIEIFRRTEQNLRHTIDGSRPNGAEARNQRLRVGAIAD